MQMTAKDKRDAVAATLLGLAAAVLPRMEKRRADRMLEMVALGRRQGVIEGANAMLQELSPQLKGKAHEAAYQAFWHVYDRRESL